MPNITPLPTPIHLEFPYDADITTKEEAANYIIDQCKLCPRYAANWDCSGALSYKCKAVTYDLVQNIKAQLPIHTSER